VPARVTQNLVQQNAEETAKVSKGRYKDEHHARTFERLEIFSPAEQNQRQHENNRKGDQ